MQYTEVEPQAEKIRNWDAWSKWVLFLLLGYSLTGRSFAYLGIPPAKLFIGDLTLAAFIFLRPRRLFDPWIKALTKTSPLSPFAWLLLASIAYGIFEVIRGVLAGFSPVIAFENLVFNIYPIFLFLGIWVGARRPELLLKYIQIYAVLFCIYAPAYLLFLNKIVLTMPGSDGVTVFGQAGGGGFIILALLCLDPKPSRFWLPMTVGAIQFLAGQVRAEWVGMGMALLIWGFLSKKMSKVAAFGAAIVLLLAVGFLLDVNIPSPQERGGNISSQEIVARGLAAVSPALAQDVTGSANVGFYNGTITWRETWWRAIWANSPGKLHQPPHRSRLRIFAQEPGELPQDFRRYSNPAQHFLLCSRLQRLDRRDHLLFPAGRLRGAGMASLQAHRPILWSCHLGLVPVYRILWQCL